MSEETAAREAWRNGWIDTRTFWKAIDRPDLLRFLAMHCSTCRCDSREPPGANRGLDQDWKSYE